MAERDQDTYQIKIIFKYVTKMLMRRTVIQNDSF